MENENQDQQSANDEYEQAPTMKQWLQDNLRIIVSIFVVVILATGIYSYSNRQQVPETKEQTEQSNLLKDLKNDKDKTTEMTDQTENAEVADQKEEKTIDKQDTPVVTSQETENSFIETAVKGDSLTKLARKALADYLEKNPDSSLTAEHKIYIEDYLRKNASHQGKVVVGTSVEFSKSLVNDAINLSKNLNERQLQNLHKYAVRVPSLM